MFLRLWHWYELDWWPNVYIQYFTLSVTFGLFQPSLEAGFQFVQCAVNCTTSSCFITYDACMYWYRVHFFYFLLFFYIFKYYYYAVQAIDMQNKHSLCHNCASGWFSLNHCLCVVHHRLHSNHSLFLDSELNNPKWMFGFMIFWLAL